MTRNGLKQVCERHTAPCEEVFSSCSTSEFTRLLGNSFSDLSLGRINKETRERQSLNYLLFPNNSHGYKTSHISHLKTLR